jgi:formylmethanofuran dehydrogenase subunit B
LLAELQRRLEQSNVIIPGTAYIGACGHLCDHEVVRVTARYVAVTVICPRGCVQLTKLISKEKKT